MRATLDTIADAIGLLCIVLFAMGVCGFGSFLHAMIGG
jgi:hypothetical protein